VLISIRWPEYWWISSSLGLLGVGGRVGVADSRAFRHLFEEHHDEIGEYWQLGTVVTEKSSRLR